MRLRTVTAHVSTRALAFIGAAAALAAFQLGILLPIPTRAVTGAEVPAAEQQLFALTNQARAAAGLPALAWNPTLSAIAGGAPISLCGLVLHGRSEDMLERGYFSHNVPPCGTFAWPAMSAAGIDYSNAGENIGWNNQPAALTVSAVQTQFMQSAAHRANILGQYNQVGIGVYRAGGPYVVGGVAYQGVVMYTEMFAEAPLIPHTGGLLRAVPALPVRVPTVPQVAPQVAPHAAPQLAPEVATPVVESQPPAPVFGPPAPPEGYTYQNRWRVGPGLRLL